MAVQVSRRAKTAIVSACCVVAEVAACQEVSRTWAVTDMSHVTTLWVSETLVAFALAAGALFLWSRWQVSGRGRERSHLLLAMFLVAPLWVAALWSVTTFYEGDVPREPAYLGETTFG